MMNEYEVESGKHKLMIVAHDKIEAIEKVLTQLEEYGRESRLGLIIRIRSSEGNFLATTKGAMERYRKFTG